MLRGQEKHDCHGCGDFVDGCSIPATAVQKPVMDDTPLDFLGVGFRAEALAFRDLWFRV